MTISCCGNMILGTFLFPTNFYPKHLSRKTPLPKSQDILNFYVVSNLGNVLAIIDFTILDLRTCFMDF